MRAVGTPLMSLAMTRFEPIIEPITYPTPSRCVTCYATDAGWYTDNSFIGQTGIGNIPQAFSEPLIRHLK